jgi:hypothetical protein
MAISYEWRGEFTSPEANALHAECFDHPVLGDDEWDWRGQVEWLHVDFEDHLRGFYFDACGFTPTNAGLIEL